MWVLILNTICFLDTGRVTIPKWQTEVVAMYNKYEETCETKEFHQTIQCSFEALQV